MRALIFGETGQVARELGRAAPAFGIAAQRLGRAAADLADPEACARTVAAGCESTSRIRLTRPSIRQRSPRESGWKGSAGLRVTTGFG